MNKLYLLSGMALLLLCAGCGNSNNGVSTGFGGGGTAGSFGQSSLSGNYAYQITGFDLGNGVPFRESGAFVADGNGHITGGEDDFAEGSTVLLNVMAPGTYNISNDGTGVVTLNFNNGGGLQVAIALESAPTVYMAVNATAQGGANLVVNGTGVAKAQTTSAFAAVPSGTFVFRTHNLSAVQGSSATVGEFTVAGGTVSAGSEDQWKGGALSQLTLTGGQFIAPDSFGRGTATLTDNNGTTSSYSYYVTDSGHLYLFSTLGTGSIGVGQAEVQSGTFSATSLSGNYVFGSRGDDSFSTSGVNTVGQFSAGSGSVTGGQFDSVQDGSVVNGTFSASTYTVAANGRAVVNLAPSTGTAIQEILWMISPSRAFLLTNDTTKVEDGTVDLQQSSSFSNSSLNGQFGFAMDGFLIPPSGSAPLYDRAGYLHWDGAGNLAVKEFLNISGGAQTPGILNGSYMVGNNGRVTGNISTLSGNLIFYLISNNQAYVLQGDTGAEIIGMMGTIP
jgi:hypothetical protein